MVDGVDHTVTSLRNLGPGILRIGCIFMNMINFVNTITNIPKFLHDTQLLVPRNIGFSNIFLNCFIKCLGRLDKVTIPCLLRHNIPHSSMGYGNSVF